jgi:Ca2+-binding EF-hand superfamily protein
MADIDVNLLWVLFRRIDKSRDGHISVRELTHARKSGDLDISPEEAKALMRFSDEGDDGKKQLSFAAFYVATTDRKLDPRITPSLLSTFTKIDMNNDGYVDKKDLSKAIEVRCCEDAHTHTRAHASRPRCMHIHERTRAPPPPFVPLS